MVDAYEAVKLSIYLAEANLTGTIDVTSQVHISNSSVNASTGLHEIRGLAWGQSGSIASVEFRIGTVRGRKPPTKLWRVASLPLSDSSGLWRSTRHN